MYILHYGCFGDCRNRLQNVIVLVASNWMLWWKDFNCSFFKISGWLQRVFEEIECSKHTWTFKGTYDSFWLSFCFLVQNVLCTIKYTEVCWWCRWLVGRGVGGGGGGGGGKGKLKDLHVQCFDFKNSVIVIFWLLFYCTFVEL